MRDNITQYATGTLALLPGNGPIHLYEAEQYANNLTDGVSLGTYGGACAKTIVPLNECCKNKECCQMMGNGVSFLNCNNINIAKPFDASAGPACSSKKCQGEGSCIKVVELVHDTILKVSDKCCTAGDNGSFLCGNTVHCNQQTSGQSDGETTQMCCGGNCRN